MKYFFIIVGVVAILLAAGFYYMQHSFSNIESEADAVDFAHVESVEHAHTFVPRDSFVRLEYDGSPHYMTQVVMDQNSDWKVNQDVFAEGPLSTGKLTLMTDLFNEQDRDMRMGYYVYTLAPSESISSFSLDEFVTNTFKPSLKLAGYHVHAAANNANSYDKSHIAKNQSGELILLRVVAFKNENDTISMTTFEAPLDAYTKEDEARFIVFTSGVGYAPKL